MRIRHYGLPHRVQRQRKLQRIRQLLGLELTGERAVEPDTESLIEQLTGVDPTRCPLCGRGRLRPLGAVSLLGRWLQRIMGSSLPGPSVA